MAFRDKDGWSGASAPGSAPRSSLRASLDDLERSYRRRAGCTYVGSDDSDERKKAQPTSDETAASQAASARTRPSETETEPVDTAASPVEIARNRPSETETEPVDTAASPVETARDRPSETETEPVDKVEVIAPPPNSKIGTARQIEAKAQPRQAPISDGGGGGPIDRGGGGGGGGPRMQKRAATPDFQRALRDGLSTCRRNLTTVLLFSIVANLLLLAIPIYLFQLSDRVLTSRSTDTLVMLTIVVVGAIGVHVLLDMCRRLVLMRVAVEMESKLGAPVLSAAAKGSYTGAGREFQALADLQQLRSFVTGSTLLNLFDLPVAPLYLLVVYLIHPQLGLVVLVASGLLLSLALINQFLVTKPFGTANAYAMRANLQADAMARNTQVINAMGMIPESVLVWGRETAESLKSQVTAQDRNVVMAGLSKMTRLSTQITILGWGSYLALGGELTGGTVIAASIIGSRALAPVEGAIEGWRNFVQSRAAYGRIRNLLRNSPLNLRRLQLPRPQGRLDVERLLYVPPPQKRVILNGINFSLKAGEAMAIVGESGAGKSTLGRILVGSILPTAGNVRLDLMDLHNWDPRQFGESVGYLPQDVQLFPASIKDNIARLRPDATDEMIYDAAELADVHEMISHLPAGYETQIGVDGAPLSGGQKQRIGLARAFFGNPQLVVLDEPNSNLDVPGEKALAKAIARAKQQKITVVAITQRPSLLRSVDVIMVLKNGAIDMMGRRDEMLKHLGMKPNAVNSAPGKLNRPGSPPQIDGSGARP